MTGKSRRHIEQLMKFSLLPQAALDILASSEVDLGSNAAEELAALAGRGMATQVVAAVTALAAGELNQQQAVRFAAASTEKKTPKKTTAVTIRHGRAVYCTLAQASKVLRIEFGSQEEAVAAQEAVRETLSRLAERKKTAG